MGGGLFRQGGLFRLFRTGGTPGLPMADRAPPQVHRSRWTVALPPTRVQGNRHSGGKTSGGKTVLAGGDCVIAQAPVPGRRGIGHRNPDPGPILAPLRCRRRERRHRSTVSSPERHAVAYVLAPSDSGSLVGATIAGGKLLSLTGVVLGSVREIPTSAHSALTVPPVSPVPDEPTPAAFDPPPGSRVSPGAEPPSSRSKSRRSSRSRSPRT